MTTSEAEGGAFLPDLEPGVQAEGLAVSGVVEVVAVERYGLTAANVVYRTPDGSMDQRVVISGQEQDIRVIAQRSAARFDGDGELFRLGMEAQRIGMASR